MTTKTKEINYLADAGRVLREYVEAFPTPDQLFIEKREGLSPYSGMKLVSYVPQVHFDVGVHIPSEGGFFGFQYCRDELQHRLNTGTPLTREGISLEMKIGVEEADAVFVHSERAWEFEAKLGGNKELTTRAELNRRLWDGLLQGKVETKRQKFTANNFNQYKAVIDDFETIQKFFWTVMDSHFPKEPQYVTDAQPYRKVHVSEVDVGTYRKNSSIKNYDAGKYTPVQAYLQRIGMSVARLEEELAALGNADSDFGLSVSVIVPERIAHQDFLAHPVSQWMVSQAMRGSRTETVEQHQYFITGGGKDGMGMVPFFLASYDLARNADFSLFLQWIRRVHESAEEYLGELYERSPRSSK